MRSHKWGGQYVMPGSHVGPGKRLEAALRQEERKGSVMVVRPGAVNAELCANDV